MKLLLDTDFLIYFFHGDKETRFLLQKNHVFYYSYVTKKELLKKRGLSDRERKIILSLLGRIRQIPIDEKIATLAEQLLKQYKQQGLQTADALIAASALTWKCSLVTFNTKHYRFIEELSLFDTKNIAP